MDLYYLYKFFTRRSSDAEVSQIRSWADSSKENMDTLLRQRRMFDALLLLGDEYTAKKNLKKKRFYQYISYAAVIAGVALVSIFVTLYFQPQPQPEMMVLKVPPGQQLELMLADGTNVHINGGSSLSYPTVFAKNERKVEMEGQCYFEVAKSPDRPFIINTSLGKVQVLGTTLNVDVSTKESYFNTALIEGKANVESNGHIYKLTPGEMVTISGKGKAVVSPIPQNEKYLWTQGIINFQDQSFPDLMKKFEKYFGLTIVINNPEKFSQSYTGKFYINDGIEYVLKVLQYDTGFNYDWDHANQTITIY